MWLLITDRAYYHSEGKKKWICIDSFLLRPFQELVEQK